MIMKKIHLIFSVLISACVLSCTQDNPEFVENKVYIERESVERVVELPVSIHDTYEQYLIARVPLKAENDIKVKFSADRSMVAEYNNFYGEEAELLPSENYYFDQITVEIAKGTVFAPENKITFEGLLDLDPDIVYVLPVTVKSYDVDTLEERAVVYYVFRRAGIVTVVANMDNNGSPVAARVAWSDFTPVRNPSGFTYEALMWCTFTSDGLPYDNARKNLPKGHEDMNIMAMMGDMKTPDAMCVRYYLAPRNDGGNYWFELSFFNNSGVGGNAEGEHPQGQDASEQFKFYPDRKWFHWAVTYDKASGVISWYCDGKLMSSRNCGTNKTVSIVNPDNELSVNNWYLGRGDTWFWTGKLSEVRIWNRALSEDELNSLNHAYYVDPATAEGLACYWKFNEGTGGTVLDHSGYGNHAQVDSESPILWEKVDLPEKGSQSENE